MKTKFIEVTQDKERGMNWGKFLLMRFDSEWEYKSMLDPGPLLPRLGWARHHLWVLDLQTGEGAFFSPGGIASCDLQKHRVWVCPMYEPFLEWLYRQDLTDLDKLPGLVELPNAPGAIYGYRREGPVEQPKKPKKTKRQPK